MSLWTPCESSLLFCMMCFVYRLNRQGEKMHPCLIPLPIVLTVVFAGAAECLVIQTEY